MKERTRLLLSFILHAIIFVLVVAGTIWMMCDGSGELSSRGFGALRFYTVLSNLLLGIFSLVYCIYLVVITKKGKPFGKIMPLFNFISVFGTTLTFLTVVAYLGPLSGYGSMFTGANLFFHLIVPLLGMAAFLCYDKPIQGKWTLGFWGYSTVLLYAVFYVLNYYCHWTGSEFPKGKITYDWYGFIGTGEPLHMVLIALAMLAFCGAICFGLYWGQRGINHLYASKEAKSE